MQFISYRSWYYNFKSTSNVIIHISIRFAKLITCFETLVCLLQYIQIHYMTLLFWQKLKQQISGNWRLFVISLFVAGSCANPVAPTGGPRDSDPPKMLRSVPENGSVNFKENEITIYFDEYIQLKGLQQSFLSSPPFKKVPETRVKGKSLVIRLTEELRDNTTYTLFFGNSITDLNEGNPIQNFRYVFSTGPVLDSMEIAGKVMNAYSLKPEKDIFVMLYDDFRDSIPYLERPYYVSKTDDDGLFYFTNLRNVPYKIFALSDMNANLIYDLPNEEIAFIKDSVYPVISSVSSQFIITTPDEAINTNIIEHPGSEQNKKELPLIVESGIQEKNNKDSLRIKNKHDELQLYLFVESDLTQGLQKADYYHPDRLIFTFRQPVEDLTIRLIPETDSMWYLTELNKTSDTLYYWLTEIERDSLKLELGAKDLETDTIQIPLVKLHKYRSEEENSTIKLDVRHNVSRSKPFNLNEPVTLIFSEPISDFQKDRIQLMEDSVIIEPKIRFTDEIKRTLSINHSWKDTTAYSLLIPDSVFTSIYGSCNDTLNQTFKTRASDDYANLKIKLDHDLKNGQLLIMLFDDHNAVIKQTTINVNEKEVVFSFLLPGKYFVRAIYDSNSNGKWDSGNYLNKKQPEKVFALEKTIELRSNWDLEETLIIPDIKDQ